ncbi:hypothetical protein [Actinomarinicola tropica]|uniref:Uncharacterized protein n=1 Tax=Actinomarinicola tropica TaxID=2789776 RepID=A0A5Q2RNR8_9ACTN|nr:hypothetical protein [Actinomarinicola tropica]QGG95737.1 hypothetical protein GH723_11860 [Actinomarinicola tropica]
MDEERPKPRLWVLIGGAWMALCWIGIIASFASGNPGPALLFVVLMVPVNLLWRFVYWRRRRTPEYRIMRNAPTSGFTTDHMMVGLTYGGSTLDDKGMRRMQADYAAADARQAAGPNVTGRILQRGVNRGCGSMVAGFIFPMRDAWRELRFANGGRKPPVI